MVTPEQRWNDMVDQNETLRIYLNAKIDFTYEEWKKAIIGACEDIIFDAKKITKADFGRIYTK